MARRWSCVLVILSLFLCFTSSMEAEEKTGSQDLSTLSKDKSGSLFKLEKKDQTNLLQLKGTANDRKQTGRDQGSFGLQALYGHLFLPAGDTYSAYYLLTGMVESDYRQRFNASVSYFPPKIGGETKLTYRLLHAQIHDTFPMSGEFEEGALEQGIGFTYKKYLTFLLKEFGLKYAHTHLGGESILQGPYVIDSPAAWRKVQTGVGFGDIDTHDALLEVAAGSDEIDNPVLQGIRLDLGGGYQHVNYDEFLSAPEITDEGFTGTAELKACTPWGVLKGMYQDSQANKTAYGAYQLGGLEVYYRNIDYPYGQDEEIIGMAFTLDLFDTGASFDIRCRPFFHSSEEGYTDVGQMEHIRGLGSDEFTAKPRVVEIIDDIYRVEKEGLPGNVTVEGGEGTGEAGLVVRTRCPQTGIRSISPAGAAEAVDVNDRMIGITLAGLPTDQQTVVIRTNDSCCESGQGTGYTQVTMLVDTGSLVIGSVNVLEGVGCPEQQEQETGTGSAQGQGQSQGQTYLANGQPCNDDIECQTGVCGVLTKTCGGDNNQQCAKNYQCKVRICASGRCGQDLYGYCDKDNECKSGNCNTDYHQCL